MAHHKQKEESEGLSNASKRVRYSNSKSSLDPDLGFIEGTAVTDVKSEIEVLPAESPVVTFTGVSFSG
jgi:hypothetical protein